MLNSFYVYEKKYNLRNSNIYKLKFRLSINLILNNIISRPRCHPIQKFNNPNWQEKHQHSSKLGKFWTFYMHSNSKTKQNTNTKEIILLSVSHFWVLLSYPTRLINLHNTNINTKNNKKCTKQSTTNEIFFTKNHSKNCSSSKSCGISNRNS